MAWNAESSASHDAWKYLEVCTSGIRLEESNPMSTRPFDRVRLSMQAARERLYRVRHLITSERGAMLPRVVEAIMEEQCCGPRSGPVRPVLVFKVDEQV